MAKMFYTLDEAASKLGVSPDKVRELASSGQLSEFRDRDRLMFKVEQVDLLAKGDDDIPLADSGSDIPLAPEDSARGGSGPGITVEDSPKERSGISIFDADQLEQADPSAVTQVTAATQGELAMENVGSGSGLLDLTREGDDTSLGADLLEGVYSNEAPATSETGAASGLFEPTGTASDVAPALAAIPGMLVAVEPYDGAWSGIGMGLALGIIVVLGLALTLILMGMVGMTNHQLLGMMSGNYFMWVGIFAGIVLLPAIIGWLVMRKS